MATNLSDVANRYPGSLQRRSQPERNAEMRSALARAAFEEIAEKGHSDFRTAPVHLRAGVSKGAMQHYFPTKDTLTIAAVEYALTEASSSSSDLLERPAHCIRDIVVLLLEDLVAFFNDSRFMVALDITLHAAKNRNLTIEIRKITEQSRQSVYDRWAARLETVGVSTPKAHFAVRTAAALVAGAAMRKLWTADPPDLLDNWTDMIAAIAAAD